MKSIVMGAVAVVALSSAAHASVIPLLNGIAPDGADFKFSYTGQLSADQGVTVGDKLVILDFAGYVPGSVHSSLPNVSASVSNTLPTGLLLPPDYTDNSSIPDLVFTYNGPDYQTTGGPYPSITNFAGLSADSIYGAKASGYFSAEAVKNDGPASGTAAFNLGKVDIPAVPEPATWALLILGFGMIGTMLRTARQRHDTGLQRL